MGFNKRILPSKEKLQGLVYDFGVGEVISRYKNADMLMGDTDAMESNYTKMTSLS